jgi:hypothetical protein
MSGGENRGSFVLILAMNRYNMKVELFFPPLKEKDG